MYCLFFKRLLDIVLSLTALIALLGPLTLVAIFIKLDSRGPVFFRQTRAGKNLVPFRVYKFRTMKTSAPKNSPTNSFKDANMYITRVGKVLRKLSIDELPQLLNVLRGEMSIVGPRPVIVTETNLLRAREKYNANVLVPGITGWAQVNGRDELSVSKKAKMDGEYAQSIGIMMDIKCLLMTIWAVLAVKGHKEGHQVEDEFDLVQVTLSEAE